MSLERRGVLNALILIKNILEFRQMYLHVSMAKKKFKVVRIVVN